MKRVARRACRAAVPAAALAALAVGAQGQDHADREIRALVDALPASGCEFERNGIWHGGDQARQHLLRKYDQVRRVRPAASAEEFIAEVATASSASGQRYRVRCPGLVPLPAAEWMGSRLRQLRTGRP